MKVIYADKIDFPSVTICNQNSYRYVLFRIFALLVFVTYGSDSQCAQTVSFERGDTVNQDPHLGQACVCKIGAPRDYYCSLLYLVKCQTLMNELSGEGFFFSVLKVNCNGECYFVAISLYASYWNWCECFLIPLDLSSYHQLPLCSMVKFEHIFIHTKQCLVTSTYDFIFGQSVAVPWSDPTKQSTS